MQVKLKQRHT